MSTHDKAHEGEGHEHISSIKSYLLVAGTLYLLTILTVAVSRVDVGEWNLVVAMLIAVIKGSLVALFFMHLYYDNKLYGSFFLGALVFLGIFITITMLDTMKRNDLYEEVAHPIRPEAVIYDSTGVPLKAEAEGHALEGAMKETHESGAEEAAPEATGHE